MIEVNKRLKGYIASLFLLGGMSVELGVMLSLMSFKDTINNTIISFIPGIIGAIGGYIFITWKPGGQVNYYFTKHTPNKDELQLSELIAKYSNRKFTIAGIVIYIISYIVLNLIFFNHIVSFNIDNILGSFFMPFICTMLLCSGTKYLSAWWNIKKNTKDKLFTLTYPISLIVIGFMLIFFLKILKIV